MKKPLVVIGWTLKLVHRSALRLDHHIQIS